jgi:hypothetical protein
MRDVDGIDGRVGEQGVVAAVDVGDLRVGGEALADSGEREPTAMMSLRRRSA